jgi:hypothetical protein
MRSTRRRSTGNYAQPVARLPKRQSALTKYAIAHPVRVGVISGVVIAAWAWVLLDTFVLPVVIGVGLAVAEIEAVEYGSVVESEYLGLAQCFHSAAGQPLDDGDEVFSLLRDSELSPDDYLARFFATGSEYQGTVE